MFKNNSILGDLITSAIEGCCCSGEGVAEDDEFNTGFRVTAEWVECKDPAEPDVEKTIIEITVLQDGVVKLSYQEIETMCLN